jgi:hypothetical protein
MSALTDALLAERFGASHWWTGRHEPPDTERDNDMACARRRRELAAAATDQPTEETA